MLMIGGIMLLIPGIAMTNAARDMLTGDIASGMPRAFKCTFSSRGYRMRFCPFDYYAGGCAVNGGTVTGFFFWFYRFCTDVEKLRVNRFFMLGLAV